MNNSFNQRYTESVLYRQTIVNDVISTAIWSIAPSGTVTDQNDTGTDSTVMVSGLVSGTKYTLSVLVTCTSGQIFAPSVTIYGI